MDGFAQKTALFWLGLALAAALMLGLLIPAPAQAGDPDEIIGPMNIEKFECLDFEGDDGEDKDPPEEVNIDSEIEQVKRESVGDIQADIDKLAKACRRAEDGAELRPIRKTRIEGVVYEFHPRDPDNPATSEWFAVPSRDVPVVAEGVTFEVFWGSEVDGAFYYPTPFGEGPIVLNLRLPEDAHPLNPNILIESTGLDETWTVFLAFYRGDTPPPDPGQLRLPDGNFLPFGSSKFESIVGLDGKSALPGVGGVLPTSHSTPVTVLAVTLALMLPAVGFVRMRRSSLPRSQRD